jgi:hypothetical protein
VEAISVKTKDAGWARLFPGEEGGWGSTLLDETKNRRADTNQGYVGE